jgi:hypothetical protein
MIHITKNVMIYMVLYTSLLVAKNHNKQKPLSLKKIKKIEVFEQRQQTRGLVVDHDDRQIDLRCIKRRYPKQYTISSSQDEGWPDAFGYNPKKAYIV